MPRALIVPLVLNSDGSFADTEDPAVIMRQRIVDLLVTGRWERVHRPNHGCDLDGFLFTGALEHLLLTKANEIRSKLNNNLNYGEVVQVLMHQIEGAESAVQVQVLYRVFEGGPIESATQTVVATPPEGELP